MWGHQPTFLFCGIILAVLLLFDGVELIDQSQDRTNKWDPPMHHPTKFKQKISHVSGQDTTEPTAGTSQVTMSHGTPRMHGPSQTTETPTDGICTSGHLCESLLNDTLSKMNTKVDRCDDFYSYACGGFTEIPKGRKKVTTMSVFFDQQYEHLVKTVTQMDTNETLPYQVVRKLYDRCMDTNKIEKESKNTLLDVLDSLGGWPILKGDPWINEPAWSWEKSMKRNRELGYKTDYFFDVYVGEIRVDEDAERFMLKILYVDQPSLGLSREDFLDGARKGNVDSYFASIVNTAKLLGAEQKFAEREATRMVKFEKDLASITVPNATASYNHTTVKNFQRKYPRTDWVGYFNAILRNTSIDENEPIVVTAPSYLNQLFPLLERTPNRTLANYVMWRVIQFSSSFLSKELREAVLGVQQIYTNRTMECVDITKQRLAPVVSTLYVKNYIGDKSRRDFLVMANEIRKAFVNILTKVEWMDEITRKTTVDRMNSTVFHLGYPDELENDDKLVEYYQDLEFNPEANYLRTVLYIDKFSTTKKFKELRQPYIKTVIYFDPFGTEVVHTIVKNSIRLTPDFWQPLYFSHSWPTYKKYGVLGPVIARMMIRSLNDQRWQLDKTGIPAGWCQTNTGKAFLERGFCIMQQHINRRSMDYNTVAERILENGGILIAYNAYKQWVQDNGPGLLLPDLNLTYEQMFWLAAAQSWCSVAIDECMTTGSTSPDQFRVLETMGDLIEFSTDFGCRPESGMYPAEKCKFW